MGRGQALQRPLQDDALKMWRAGLVGMTRQPRYEVKNQRCFLMSDGKIFANIRMPSNCRLSKILGYDPRNCFR